MDITEQYEELTEKLKETLPFKAFPTRELVQELRNKGQLVTLKTEFIIIDVYNSGDISGILCPTEQREDEALVCALTHLVIPNKHPLYREILDYQKKRIKRLMKLNQQGFK